MSYRIPGPAAGLTDDVWNEISTAPCPRCRRTVRVESFCGGPATVTAGTQGWRTSAAEGCIRGCDSPSAPLRGGPTRANALSYVVHEARNALVPARFHVDRLIATSTDDAQRRRLDAIRRGLVRVLDMVEELTPLLDDDNAPAAH